MYEKIHYNKKIIIKAKKKKEWVLEWKMENKHRLQKVINAI